MVYRRDMFPILLTSLIEDCQDNVVLNWLTAKIFYAPNYTQSFVSTVLTTAGVLDNNTLNNIWFDKNYGFKTFIGFQSWVKIAANKKGINSGMGRYLITYFNISNTTMYNLVVDNSSWLVNTTTTESGNECS